MAGRDESREPTGRMRWLPVALAAAVGCSAHACAPCGAPSTTPGLALTRTGEPTPAPTTPDCDEFFSSATVTRLVSYLARLHEIATPPWTSYRPERHPVVLIGPAHPAAPTCALVQRGDRELARAALAEPVTIPTGIFWFYATPSIGPGARPEFAGLGAAMSKTTPSLAALLAGHGVDRAMLLRVDYDRGILTAVGVDPSSYFSGPEIVLLIWIVHETFHLHSQFPTWLDQAATYPWPAWDRQPDRTAVVETCYGGAAGPRVAAERAALRAAFIAAQRHDRAAACTAAREFVRQREIRHGASTDEVPAPGGAVACRVAESLMELEEGVPDYIAQATLLELGLGTDDQVLRGFDRPLAPLFYGLGAFQLLVLRALAGEEAMPAITARIAASAGPEGGVFAELARAVSDPALCGG